MGGSRSLGMGCCQPLLCLVKAISAAVQGLKRKLISDQQCRVLGAAWLSSRLFSMELLKSESINGQCVPSMEPTGCVYLSKVQVNSLPSPSPTQAHT